MNEKVNIGKVTLSVKIKRAVWNVVSAIFFRLFVTKLFRLWRIALLKCFGADLDWSVDVYASAKVWAPWNLKMEKGACLGPNTICYNQAKVWLGENACVSQYAYICTAGHQVVSGLSAELMFGESKFQVSSSKSQVPGFKFISKADVQAKQVSSSKSQVPGFKFKVSSEPVNNAENGLVVAPVTIGKNAWIGTRAYINMGVEVGEGAIVGACACVFKDVEAGTVVGGNPAVALNTGKEVS